ncbi:type II toxin-antitoxin system Phd/YefM family antitoxin [Ideonella azotifigens]|uniref:Antitoxin n=1 Tax=Ideonella azotifigens TaxID=513160 RepID=A0ABN1K334_9BURK|nr:type II toxin-antitoxin system Phd/YefM family antitoxin [Ideonella azotifigens]MCD2344632.1 type II toxin-antitoxin system Phd/YefM family antitoxin [Ideonella azotifigens]
MDSIPYSEIRAHLAETLRELEVREEPIYISRRGEPAGVLMSVAQYRRLTTGDVAPGPWAALQAWRSEHAAELAQQDHADDPFANLREADENGGRAPFEWPADAGLGKAEGA